jgi:SAM-dependent methyltransferase
VTTNPSYDTLVRTARKLDEDAWIELIRRSADAATIDDMHMPLFPAPEVQQRIVGSAGGDALHEAAAFYRIVKRSAERFSKPITESSRVMDFGCGWGRMIRYFLRDVAPQNLVGCDVLPEMIDICRSLNLRATFEVNAPEPPTSFADGSFDVIYAYSVLSHLSESLHLHWLREFKRLLRPNGILVATTHSRRFIEFCAELRRTENLSSTWHVFLARSFLDTPATLAAYDRGDFVYAPTSGGVDLPAERYGEAVVSPKYVQTMWPLYLEPVDFVDDPGLLPQALIVGKRSAY